MAKIDFDFTFENIEKLADIVNEKELSEISIEAQDVKFTIKGKKCPPPPPPMGMPAPIFNNAVATTPIEPKSENAVNVPNGNVVKSPIIGTFYSASAPDKAPFVKVGSQVKQGDVLFIIESMKVMNEVQSEFDGTVKEILVSNGDTVEYDQPMMIIG